MRYRSDPGGRLLAGLSVCLCLAAAPAAAQTAPANPPSGSNTAVSASLGTSGQPLAPSERHTVEPTRTPTAPRLDGVLDEPAWQSAAIIDQFVQQEPAEGDPATERTVVRLMYDERALYVGVEAYDSLSNGVIATEMRRDSRQLLDEDNFQLILDTFHDSRSGYMFVTSPLGAKLEQQIAEEGEGGYRRLSSSINSNVNLDWDGVWHVSTRRTAEGWVAEIAIPMVTMRFPKADRQVWGVNFMRNIRRKNEQVYWAPIPKGYDLTRVSRAGTMTGLGGVDRGLDLRITPYTLGGGRQDRLSAGRLYGSGFRQVGLDLKYGIASGLNLDVTANTDFAQVEVDEQQVNLTRFPLFFPEKRDFFLENAGMFSVKEQGITRIADLFFTRRIGLAGGQPIPIGGGHPADRQGQPAQHRRHDHPDERDRACGRPAARRELLRRPLQPRHLRAVEGGRHHREQRGDQRRALQPDVRGRRLVDAASVLLGHRIRGHDQLARD